MEALQKKVNEYFSSFIAKQRTIEKLLNSYTWIYTWKLHMQLWNIFNALSCKLSAIDIFFYTTMWNNFSNNVILVFLVQWLEVCSWVYWAQEEKLKNYFKDILLIS